MAGTDFRLSNSQRVAARRRSHDQVRICALDRTLAAEAVKTVTLAQPSSIPLVPPNPTALYALRLRPLDNGRGGAISPEAPKISLFVCSVPGFDITLSNCRFKVFRFLHFIISSVRDEFIPSVAAEFLQHLDFMVNDATIRTHTPCITTQVICKFLRLHRGRCECIAEFDSLAAETLVLLGVTLFELLRELVGIAGPFPFLSQSKQFSYDMAGEARQT